MIRGRQPAPHLGLRGWLALALCGAAIGFFMPAMAKSLIQQEHRQANVRLLPAPLAHAIEATPAQPDPPSTLGNTQPLESSRPLKVLTPAQLERKMAHPPLSHIVVSPHVRRYPSASTLTTRPKKGAGNGPAAHTKSRAGGTEAE